MANDELFDQWEAEDDASIPKQPNSRWSSIPQEPLVPRVDKFVGEKRWGVDTPMFDSKEDMHSWLWDMGMVPGNIPADITNALLYLSENEVGNAILAGSASLPLVGIGVAGFKKGKDFTSRMANRFTGATDRSRVVRGEELKRVVAESLKRDVSELKNLKPSAKPGINAMLKGYEKRYIEDQLHKVNQFENAMTLEKNVIETYRPHIKKLMEKAPSPSHYRFDAQGELMGQYSMDQQVKTFLRDPKFVQQNLRGVGPKKGWEVQDYMTANKISPEVAEFYNRVQKELDAGKFEDAKKLILKRKGDMESAMVHKGGEIYTKEIPTEGRLTMERRSKTPFDPGDYDLDR